jgi:hypothetical protein
MLLSLMKTGASWMMLITLSTPSGADPPAAGAALAAAATAALAAGAGGGCKLKHHLVNATARARGSVVVCHNQGKQRTQGNQPGMGPALQAGARAAGLEVMYYIVHNIVLISHNIVLSISQYNTYIAI